MIRVHFEEDARISVKHCQLANEALLTVKEINPDVIFLGPLTDWSNEGLAVARQLKQEGKRVCFVSRGETFAEERYRGLDIEIVRIIENDFSIALAGGGG